MASILSRVLRGPQLWILFFALSVLLLMAGGVAYFNAAYQRIENEKIEELNNVALLKVEQLAQWRKERLADAKRAANSPFFRRAVQRLLANPQDGAVREEWVERLQLEQDAYGYADVLLVTPAGEPLVSASEDRVAVHHHFELSQFSRSSPPAHFGIHEDAAGDFHFEIYAPVPDAAGRPAAILMLRSDPEQFLYPLLKFWPTASSSAETHLVDWDEGHVRFLNPLRHRPGQPPMLEIPRSRSDVVAVKVASGARGLVRGRDYRDVEVLAEAHTVPDTPWVMIAKTDASEILGRAWREAGLVAMLVVLGILLAGSATALGYRRRQARQDRVRASILESAGEGIYGIDTEGRCTFINPAGAKMLGYEPEELVGRNMHDSIHHHCKDGSEYPVENCPILRAFLKGEPCEVEDELFWRRDGSSFAAAYISHQITQDGRTIGAVITFRDITDRKQAEKALRTSQTQLSNAQRIAQLGSWELDLNSGDLSWSDEVFRIFGVETEGFGHTYEDFLRYVHPEDRARMQREQERTLRGEADLDIEHRIIRPDGEIRHVHERAELRRDELNRPLDLSGTVQDITEHKKAEEELSRQSTLLRIAGETANVGGWIFEVPEQTVIWSDEVCAIHDVQPGTSPSVEEVVEFYAPEWRDQVAREFQTCVAQGRPFNFEAEIITATGRRIWVRSTGVAERNEAGKVTRFQGAVQDITEQKRAELDAHRLAHRLSNTLESITDAFVMVDRDGKFAFVNQQAEKLLRRPREELLGRSVWEELSAMKNTVFEREYHRAVRDRVAVEFKEFFGPLRILFEVRGYPTDEGLAIYFRDITERERAEDKIREVSARLGSFLDHSPAMISEVDLNGRVLFVNRALAGLFNASAEEVTGKRIMDLISEPFALAFQERIDRIARERRPISVEDTTPVESGQRTFTTLFPLFNANQEVTSVGSIGIEVTEQRQAREVLRESETLRVIASQVALLGGWRADFPSGVITSSDEMCAILEVPPGTKRTLGDALNDYAPESQEAVSRAFTAALSDGKPIDVEARLVTATGKRVWVRTIGHALRNEKGEIFRLQGATQDISSRKREEAEMEKLETQLRQAQKMEAVGRLAGGVAHDFNNMLTVIQGYSQMALDDLDGSHPLRMNIEEIMEAAKRSEELTRQLLAFARQQTIAPRVLDLNDTISSMLKMLGRLIGENIDLSWKPGADVGQVRMDPVQVDQILANLAVNARDAIADTGVLTIATSVTELDEAYCEAQPELTPGEYIVVTVSDTGHGMNRETLDQIFDPFFTTKEPGKGTGLGLSTVYGILKQNTGHITGYSEPGQGTTFNIYLPRAEAKEPARGRAYEAEPLPRGTETLMLVEDEAALLGLTQRLLEELGYTVLAATEPEKALEIVEQTDGIDLLVTDVVMPKMSGRELWERLQLLRPGLKVLFISGYTSDVIAHHGVLHEGLVFLQKPFSRQSLAAKVREALNND